MLRTFATKTPQIWVLRSPATTSRINVKQFHCSTVPGSRNKTRRIKKINPMLQAKFEEVPVHKMDPKTPKAPLTRTEHPSDRFEDEDAELQKIVAEASDKDRPDFEMNDPYTKKEVTCILCPKRYAVPIRPHYKNPKLLAQFISPHTGLVYKSHITGLCASMQKEVEYEVNKAKALGFLATKMKELHYLKDFPLFNPSRPMKKNPY